MPGSYLIDVPRRTVFTRGWGVLTDEEIIAHARALRADPRFEPRFSQIIDFSDLEEIKATATAVERIAERNPFDAGARRAFVVATDEMHGMVRMYWSYTGVAPEQFKLFRSLAPALEWLGLEGMTQWPKEPPDATFGV
jgi:hypothetical protein